MAKILLIDDEKNIRRVVSLFLEENGHEVVVCESGKIGLEKLENESFDLILTDLKMPQLSGIDFLRTIRKSGDDTPVIMLTAYGSVESAVEAIKLGATDYLTKPPKLEEIELKISNALSRKELSDENRRLRQELESKFRFDEIIGKSPAMIKVFERLRPLASDHNISILLHGESGTGKELIARAVHYNSPRADRPFVAINCSALPDHLLESELFGHEKGAFTGADMRKKGLFETAHGGTILLDEISAMPLEMQAKLLRAIEEREIRRVGSTETIPLDVRFIAASNQDLLEAVGAGRFRQDLYYRLAVATVDLPPLRERFGDVRLLAQHFLEKYNREKQKACVFEHDVMDILERQTWLGNVRELENLVELLVVTAPSKKISETSLPRHIIENSIERKVEADLETLGDNLKVAAKRNTELFERAFIVRQLEKNNGHVTKTAEAMGVSRSSLHAKMKEYGIGSADNEQ